MIEVMSKFCVYCGAPVEEVDRFCGACGRPNKRAQAPAPTRHWSLVVREKGNPALTYVVDREFRLGRASECEIRFKDKGASRVHAMIRPAPEGIWLTDNNSTNGTEVGGRRIKKPTLLSGGETVRIAETRFEVLSPGHEGHDATMVMAPPSVPVSTSPPSATQAQCSYCQSPNSFLDSVCRRCGRQLSH